MKGTRILQASTEYERQLITIFDAARRPVVRIWLAKLQGGAIDWYH